jgi:hypothetical protein
MIYFREVGKRDLLPEIPEVLSHANVPLFGVVCLIPHQYVQVPLGKTESYA